VTVNPTMETAEQQEQERLAQLLKRAEQGDCSVQPELREMLATNPNLWKGYGDLAAQAEGALIQLAAGPNLLMAASLLRKLKALKDELGGESPSPLERLLVERITTTWLQITYYDAHSAQATGAREARSKLLLRQQDAAHRRHLEAVKILATVRKLLTPAPSPVEVASRLDRSHPATRRGRMGMAETVPVSN
jgi:hypothetical protein